MEGIGCSCSIWCSEIGAGGLPVPRTPLGLETDGGKVVAIIEDRARRLWIARNGGGVLRYDDATGAVDRIAVGRSTRGSLEGGFVRSLALGPDRDVWVLASAPGSASITGLPHLHRVDVETLEVRRVELRQRELRPGDDANLERVAVNPSGVLWLATHAGGLRYADVSAGGFSLYRKEFGIGPGLDSSFVRAVCVSRDGALWVGTPVGLNRIDRASGMVRHLDSSALPDASVQALHEDRRGRLWVGTRRGLVVIGPGTMRRERGDSRGARGPIEDFVQVVHEGSDGRIWLGTLGSGLAEFEPLSGSFTRHLAGTGGQAALPSDSVNALFSDARGRLWIGTDAGLVSVNPGAGGVRQFERAADDANRLRGVSILSIAESIATPGVLWLGTSRGLCQLTVRGQTVRFYTSRNSDLADDTIYGVLPDRRGRLWMSTNRGLVCFDPVAGTFRTYGADRGLQSSEFNARAYFQAPDGEMFFGGVGGLNAFFPDRVSDNPHPPLVFITEVRTLDRDSSRSRPAESVYRHGMPRFDVEDRLPAEGRHLRLRGPPLQRPREEPLLLQARRLRHRLAGPGLREERAVYEPRPGFLHLPREGREQPRCRKRPRVHLLVHRASSFLRDRLVPVRSGPPRRVRGGRHLPSPRQEPPPAS